MYIQGNSLFYKNTSVKAFTGNVGNREFNHHLNNSYVMVGGCKFPTVTTYKFTPNPNGEIAIINDQINIAYGNIWQCLNTITVLVSANTGEGQQAFFTIQHGTQSQIAINGENAQVTFLHEPNSPLLVTASNFSTGATNYAQAFPVAGQAYRLTSSSETHVEGELKTTGGDLISGGEKKNIFMRWETTDDDSQVETIFDSNVGYEKSIVFSTTATFANEKSAVDYMSASVDSLEQKLNAGDYDADNAGDAKWLRFKTEFAKAWTIMHLFLKNNETGELIALNNDEKVSPPVGKYKLVCDVLISQREGRLMPATSRGLVTIENKDVVATSGETELFNKEFVVNKDETYKFTWNQTGDEQYHLYAKPSGTHYLACWQGALSVRLDVKVTGPYGIFCADWQTLDTTFSYTTPVVTTDTRHTVSTIAINLKPIN